MAKLEKGFLPMSATRSTEHAAASRAGAKVRAKAGAKAGAMPAATTGTTPGNPSRTTPGTTSGTKPGAKPGATPATKPDRPLGKKPPTKASKRPGTEADAAAVNAIALDALDLRILEALRQDARASLQHVGRAVGLSTTPCWNRIKRMEALGVIEGYTVALNAQALGYRDVFIVQVTLESHSDDMLAAFGRALADIPEVTEALLVSGDYDYVLRVVVKDTRDYERLLREKLYKIPGIRHSRSSVVLRSLKAREVPLPLR